jgi:hypothetical protein
MSRKTICIGFFTLSIFCFSPMIYAEQYYDQYPGNGFVPNQETAKYFRSYYGFILHNNTDDEEYFCPVTFNVPDGSVYFIKSIGIRYKDNLSSGKIMVQLRRLNLYTGADHDVAFWESDLSGASISPQTYSQGTYTGLKLIDTKKFSYWLRIYFYADGDTNPYDQLVLYQVRIHYGT